MSTGKTIKRFVTMSLGGYIGNGKTQQEPLKHQVNSRYSDDQEPLYPTGIDPDEGIQTNSEIEPLYPTGIKVD